MQLATWPYLAYYFLWAGIKMYYVSQANQTWPVSAAENQAWSVSFAE